MSFPLETGVISRDEEVTRNQICDQTPGLRYSPPQVVGKCITGNNRGAQETDTVKGYLKTLWDNGQLRKAGKGSSLWGT